MAQPPAQLDPGSGTAAISGARSALLALGRAGEDWSFLPRALRIVETGARDDELGAMLVVSLARLGVRSLALEQLAALDCARGGSIDAGHTRESLRRMIDGLADDRITAASRIEVARCNLEVLAGRGVKVSEEAFERWKDSTAREEWFRVSDGNILRRREGVWLRLADEVGVAARFQLPAETAGSSNRRPWYLDGIDTPWQLVRLAALLPRHADGFWPAIWVVEENLTRLLDALAADDLRGALSQDRVRLIAGDGALGRLEEILGADLGLTINGYILSAATSGGGSPASLERTIKGLCDRQAGEMSRATAGAATVYGERGIAWWCGRYRDALAGGGEPLRVLIPSCRYSTYVRHASADIAAAFDSIGCRSRVLIEPDDSSIFSNCAHARVIEEMRPDLVVLINYTRASLGAAVPRNVPFVCWIQDTMGHLFQRDAGKDQGALDFLVGHLHPELFLEFGFPRERTMLTPVLAGAAKFHAGSIDPGLRRRFECDIAYAGHQSETPGACRDRMLREARAAGPRNAMPSLIEALYPECVKIAQRAWEAPVAESLRGAAERAITGALGRAPEPALVAQIVGSICSPIADRAIRHEALEWAASIARRRGWRFHLHGRGWESHPTLGEYAQGVASHGEELRACYQSSRVHLHASINGMAHQRVMECALSGGLPLVRIKRDDILLLDWYTQASIASKGAPLHRIAGIPFDEVAWVHTVDHWQSLVLESQRQRFGLALLVPGRLYIGQGMAKAPWGGRMGEAMEHEAAWLLGDLSETTFFDEASLERIVARAVEGGGWRDNLSGGIAGRVKSHFTYERMAGRILDLICSSFDGAAAGAGASGPQAQR